MSLSREIPRDYEIRPARREDIHTIPAIEVAAATRFRPWGLEDLFALATTPIAELEDALRRGHLVIAAHHDVGPVGFAMCSRIDGHLHLDEIDVAPEHGRRGLGTALVEAAIAIARRERLPRITLSTMRAIPFNAPWYSRLGFRELAPDELGPGLRAALRCEPLGGFPVSERVTMARELEP